MKAKREQKPFPKLSLKDSEIRYRRLFEAALDGILILNAETGMIEDVNPYLITMLGYTREEFVEKKLWEVGAFRDIKASKEAFEELQDKEYIRYEDLPLKARDGRLVQVEFISNVYRAGDKKVIQCNIRDNAGHKLIIAALQENEKKYRDLINQSPDGYFIIELSGNILTANEAMCKELEFSEEEFLSMNIWDIIPEQYFDQYQERLTKALKGESLKESTEYMVRGKHGRMHYVEVLSAPRYSGGDIIGFQGVARDITARKRAEEALRQSETKFRRLVEHLPTVVYMNPLDDTSSTLYVSPQIESLLGYTPEEWLADPKLWSRTVHPEDRPEVLEQASLANQGREPFEMDYRMTARDGSLIWVHDRLTLVNDLEGKPQYWQGIMLDITARKQAGEQTLFQATLLDAVGQAVIATDAAGTVTYMNRAAENLYGWRAEEIRGHTILDITVPQVSQTQAKEIMSHLSRGDSWSGEFLVQHRDGRVFPAEVHDSPVFNNKNVLIGVIGVSSDITERKQAEKKIRRQIDYLTALQDIDRTIASTFDMYQSLNALIAKARSLLAMDAAAVLLINDSMNAFEFAVGSGFRTDTARGSMVKSDETHAGMVAFEHHIVKIPGLKSEADAAFMTGYLKGEKFAGYYGVPLVIKGRVIGVFEVFQRSLIKRDQEWLDFLNALAGQAAIAINTARLFESLQQSNSELTQAYNATIEGWSRALDLRDKETEGHSLRVTEMTVELARAFGLSDTELVQVRWGSLLHDIGKMGIPDGILLKPSALTDEEWVLMKKHPTFAYEMLSPIHYLRLALDIPYCHHEKWDGSGYPRGLTGEQIPLTARIFAVVDVWDALTSDRPYRPAWTEEETLEYIRTSAGAHFDPQVVAAFIQVNGRRSMTK
jgi:PAS domain S-box-containing protein/putative nucleotidyltransferase with HDIG domain